MERMTIEQYKDYINRKQSKYGNKKTEIDGYTFDSELEARYYGYLKILMKANIVDEIELQPRFRLQEGFTKNGTRHSPIDYVADFRVEYKNGETQIVDVKGHETEVFKIKRKLFEYKYKDLNLKLVGKDDF